MTNRLSLLSLYVHVYLSNNLYMYHYNVNFDNVVYYFIRWLFKGTSRKVSDSEKSKTIKI